VASFPTKQIVLGPAYAGAAELQVETNRRKWPPWKKNRPV
jgi:hypothetical protein